MGDFKCEKIRIQSVNNLFVKKQFFSDKYMYRLTFMEFQYVKKLDDCLKKCPHFKFHKLSLSKGVGPLLRRNGRGLFFCAPLTYIPTLYYLTYILPPSTWGARFLIDLVYMTQWRLNLMLLALKVIHPKYYKH